jgi:tetratricopeptide (TPR) repeat protein
LRLERRGAGQYNVWKFTALLVSALAMAAASIDTGLAQGPNADEVQRAQRRAAELKRKGDLEGAMRELDRAVAQAPGSAAAWFNRGLARRALKDCRAAVADFARALELQPDYFNALYQRGNCRQAMGTPELAVEDYSRAVGLPGRIDARFLAYFGRADAYRRLGRLEEADADYTRVLALRTDTTALRSRAWVSYYRGRWRPAYEDAEKYIHDTEGREPDAAYALALGVIALQRDGDAPRAASFLQEWQPRVNAAPWPARILGYLKSGDEAALLAAASTGGERTEAWAYIGASLLARGQQARAVALLRRVLREGDPAYLEYDLAYHELRRLGLAKPGERRSR